jgi:hypothetical protein
MAGFTLWDPTMIAKWLQILKELGPQLKQVAIMFNPDAGIYQSNLDAARRCSRAPAR